jgi:uncharacterized protein YdaT
MAWTRTDYPQSMTNMDPEVRKRAIEIANSLVDEGYDEGRAIGMARIQAKRAVRGEIDG